MTLSLPPSHHQPATTNMGRRQSGHQHSGPPSLAGEPAAAVHHVCIIMPLLQYAGSFTPDLSRPVRAGPVDDHDTSGR
ncbi:MAG: hypothetical protein EBT94_08650 [Alphaproteobacteria bacterium]|nr:hypothetical protein [Alphaproteobacteria bacterium]